jgi:hypothetical protein
MPKLPCSEEFLVAEREGNNRVEEEKSWWRAMDGVEVVAVVSSGGDMVEVNLERLG